MRLLSTDLSLGAQTSYAELLDMAGAVYGARFALLRGSFHKRQIKGRPYIYFNFRDTDGRVRSAYVGPENDRTEHLIGEFKRCRAQGGVEAMVRRSVACIALGCHGVSNRHFRVVDRLCSYGIFRRKGVLAGLHAFATIGNALGVRWIYDLPSTEIAQAFQSISVVVPADFGTGANDVLTSLELGARPLREFSGRTAEQRRENVDADLVLELVSPGDTQEKPVPIPGLACQLHPMPFADFLLENTVQGVVVSKSGACLVNLPEPAHFAIHCLLEHGDGMPAPGIDPHGKLMQSAALVDWHINERRVDSLQRAWRKALAAGPRWRHCAEAGRGALGERYAKLAAVLL